MLDSKLKRWLHEIITNHPGANAPFPSFPRRGGRAAAGVVSSTSRAAAPFGCPRVARSFLSLCLICGLTACSTPAPKAVRVTAPPTPPHVEAHPEPIVAAIPSKLPEVNLNDPVQLAISEAQARFEKGQGLYKDGSLKKAKDEFNAAIDVILDTSGQYQKDPRLQKELTELVSKVNAM